MSFKKVGINYINDKLFKCMLQSGGKYFVELRNGVRIPVSQEDYGTLVEDLVVVNGVAYADLSLIASCKAVNGGYIVEFANGNQFTITQANYEALVEAGFCAIGDTYYNPAQIDKLYEADGAYFAQLKNGQTKPITEEEYEDIVGDEPGPTPGVLTPFEVDQTTYGFYINGDLSAEQVNEIISHLDFSQTYHDAQGTSSMDGYPYCPLVKTSNPNPGSANEYGIAVFDCSEMVSGLYGIFAGSQYDGPLYFSKAVPEYEIPEGWVEDSVSGVTLLFEDKTLTVHTLEQANQSLWNGILCGANAEQPTPPSELTPFSADAND